jgi:hypothetical protein
VRLPSLSHRRSLLLAVVTHRPRMKEESAAESESGTDTTTYMRSITQCFFRPNSPHLLIRI